LLYEREVDKEMSNAKFNAVELALISTIRRQPNNWFTTNELASRIDVAWETAEKNLKSLYELIPKLEICFLGLVFQIINQAQDQKTILRFPKIKNKVAFGICLMYISRFTRLYIF
jgi:alpha-L-arabinofuranosidase